MKTFRTAGDLGDIMFQMIAMRALGGGKLMWHPERWTREVMSNRRWGLIEPLLLQQPYVQETGRWDNVEVDHNLNNFRALYFGAIHTLGGLHSPKFPRTRNLGSWICEAHGIDESQMAIPWIHVEPNPVSKIVFNRTRRYRNEQFPWRELVVLTRDVNPVFVGHPDEYSSFCKDTGFSGKFMPTQTLLDAAQVIAGADLYVGNQSVCYAIAEAMKKPAVLEVCPWLPNNLFNRPSCWHGWDNKVLEHASEFLCSIYEMSH